MHNKKQQKRHSNKQKQKSKLKLLSPKEREVQELYDYYYFCLLLPSFSVIPFSYLSFLFPPPFSLQLIFVSFSPTLQLTSLVW